MSVMRDDEICGVIWEWVGAYKWDIYWELEVIRWVDVFVGGTYKRGVGGIIQGVGVGVMYGEGMDSHG